MKSNNILLELLKFLGSAILGWLLWVIILSLTLPAETDAAIDQANRLAAILGIITGLVLSLVLKFNTIMHLKQKINEAASNIKVTLKRSDALLEKANKVVDKYIEHEGDTLLGVTGGRSTTGKKLARKIKNATQFKNTIENYPDLKANESIMELLKQLRESENIIANFKLTYNDTVTRFNTLINSFPGILVKKVSHLSDADFFEEDDTNIISDEELGI